MKYVYCESLFLSNPIEIEMTKEKALKRFKGKLEALEDHKGSLGYEGSFIGVQKREGNKREWIITN